MVTLLAAMILASSSNKDDDAKCRKHRRPLSKAKNLNLQQTFWQISLPSSHDFDGNRGIAIVALSV